MKYPAYGVSRHQLRLYNDTDNVTVLTGTSEFCSLGYNGYGKSHLQGQFTVPSGKALQLEHYIQNSGTSTTLGWAATTGENETYAVIKCWKLN